MLEIYLKISVKVTYLNYLDFAQQIISVTTLMSKYHFLKILGKKRGFAYVKVPIHVSDELLKLHGLGFNGKMLVIEKAKTLPKARNINGVNQNICPQTQISQLDSENTLASRPLQRIKNSYRNTVTHKKGDIALFSDSIPRGTNIKKINRQIQGGGIHVKAFPGAKSTQFNHYVTPTLEEYSYDAAIIHAGMIPSDPNMTS